MIHILRRRSASPLMCLLPPNDDCLGKITASVSERSPVIRETIALSLARPSLGCGYGTFTSPLSSFEMPMSLDFSEGPSYMAISYLSVSPDFQAGYGGGVGPVLLDRALGGQA